MNRMKSSYSYFVLVQNSQYGKELNQFCPLPSLLSLFFFIGICITYLQYLEVFRVLLQAGCQLPFDYVHIFSKGSVQGSGGGGLAIVGHTVHLIMSISLVRDQYRDGGGGLAIVGHTVRLIMSISFVRDPYRDPGGGGASHSRSYSTFDNVHIFSKGSGWRAIVVQMYSLQAFSSLLLSEISRSCNFMFIGKNMVGFDILFCQGIFCETLLYGHPLIKTSLENS